MVSYYELYLNNNLKFNCYKVGLGNHNIFHRNVRLTCIAQHLLLSSFWNDGIIGQN